MRHWGRAWRRAVLVGLVLAAGTAQAWAEEPKPEIPREAVQHFNAGYFQAVQGNYDEAAREYEKAIEIFPQYAQAHHNLGSILQRAGQLDEAIAHYRAALAAPGLEQSWIVHNSLGIALENTGDLEGAIAAYREAIASDPRPAFPQHNLALALVKTGDLAGALEAITKAAELAPLDPRIKHNLEIIRQRAERAAAQPPTEVTPMTTEPEEPQPLPAEPGPEPTEPSGPPEPPPAPERPLTFEPGTFWRVAEEGPGWLALTAAGVEGLQARIEWSEAQGSAADLADAELGRLERLALRAERETWPAVGGREAAAYGYDLALFGVTMRTRVVIAANEGQAYRFALSGAESVYEQGEEPFRALVESVRFR